MNYESNVVLVPWNGSTWKCRCGDGPKHGPLSNVAEVELGGVWYSAACALSEFFFYGLDGALRRMPSNTGDAVAELQE